MIVEEAAARATLADVASAAGVSKSAASKALNNRQDVSDTTRQRVLQVARELGYQRTERRRMASLPPITVVTHDLHHAYALSIIEGAVSAGLETSSSIHVTRQVEQNGETALSPLSNDWFTALHQRGCIGLVIVTGHLTDLQAQAAAARSIPVVAIDPTGRTSQGIAVIGATNWNGGMDATEHLIGLGHRRIAVIDGPATSLPARERLQGFLSAMRMHDIPPDHRLVAQGPYTIKTGYQAAHRWFSLPGEQQPTAVFAGSDACAVGVYEAARKRGLGVPQDVSVVGFDDAESASWLSPHLTTIHQPLARMGSQAVRMIVAHHAGQPLNTSTPIRLATRLVVRDSTAAPCSLQS